MRYVLLSVLFCALASPSRADFRAYEAIPSDPALSAALEEIAVATLARYAGEGLKDGHLSISLVDLSEPGRPMRAAYREDITYHPASTVKAFFLATVYDQLASGTLTMNDELERAVRDMIVDSGNDATSYVVDRISGVTSGPELEGEAFLEFQRRRDVTNRYFRNLGYDINANGKTWCENVYGREKQLLGPNREYRNRITSAAAASFMYALATRNLVSGDASDAMLEWMHRSVPPREGETQVAEFIGAALPEGSGLWSKAGWTSEVRHDMALVELPDGRRFVLAILTRGAAGDTSLIPSITSEILAVLDDRGSDANDRKAVITLRTTGR